RSSSFCTAGTGPMPITRGSTPATAEPTKAASGSAAPSCFTRSSLAITSAAAPSLIPRSEEHTSELQSRFDLVCRLLLEKNKQPLFQLRRGGGRGLDRPGPRGDPAGRPPGGGEGAAAGRRAAGGLGRPGADPGCAADLAA